MGIIGWKNLTIYIVNLMEGFNDKFNLVEEEN